ncbi:MAG TPA: putative maltokinase [Terriglobia bacterium]|nr:putative maltokinase [Terriglobia bacterium]
MTVHDDNPLEHIVRALPQALPAFLQSKRWFAGKAETLHSIQIEDSFRMATAYFFLVKVRYASGNTQQYALPLVASSLPEASPTASGDSPQIVIPSGSGFRGCVLSDALEDPAFATSLLDCIREQVSVRGGEGELAASSTNMFARLGSSSKLTELKPAVMRVEQSNTSINYGGKLMLKFFRRPEEGVNLDFEIGRFLTEKAGFAHTPPVAGCVEYSRPGRPAMTLAVLQGFVENKGDAWKYTLPKLDEYFERNAASSERCENDWAVTGSLLELAAAEPPSFAREAIGDYLDSATLLGQRTAELHLALSQDHSDHDFAPEPLSRRDCEDLSAATLALAHNSFHLLEARLEFLPLPAREKALRVIELKGRLFDRCREILAHVIKAERTRVHGDYHLGQVLYTGTDFVIIDFEGEPERPLSQRRAKQSPLRDVAGMLRSFHYAASSALLRRTSDAAAAPVRPALLDALGRFWRRWVSAQFLRTYLRIAETAGLVPQDREHLKLLLDLFLLDKTVYEIIYELRNRPGWVSIPLDGILDA